MRNIVTGELRAPPVREQGVEVVERKGLGHPDYICDSIMNQVSVNLCAEYIDKFGAIMHHNIDKGLLVAGEVEGRFGGGEVTNPMLLVFGDRATFEVEGVQVDVDDISINTANDWIEENLRFVSPANIAYQVELKPGSAELTDIFKREGEILGANDTSAAVGYAPMTFTERSVFDIERHLNSDKFKKEYPESGEDVKVMGVRNGSDVHFTVAMPIIDRYVNSENEYFTRKEELLTVMGDYISDLGESEEGPFSTSVSFNSLDVPGRGMGGIYTTVTGTSAEDADGGQIGRGNRVNGIIPLNRPVSSEAAAGKNPVSHVGKIYNVLSHRIADRIYQNVPDVSEVYVWLLSEIGVPIDQPQIAAAQLIMEKGSVDSVKKEVDEIIDSELENIQEFCMELAKGKIPIC